MSAEYGAIVVGSGLVGGWVAKCLADGGLSVLVLEAGPSLEHSTVINKSSGDSEQRLLLQRRQHIQSRHGSYPLFNPSLFVDDVDHPYKSLGEDPFIWIRGRHAGGRSLLWGGLTLRFSDLEFSAGERDGWGPSWPISYSEVAPHYSTVERFLQIEGTRENLTQLPDGDFSRSVSLTNTEKEFKVKIEREWKDRSVIAGRGIPPPGGQRSDNPWDRKSSLGSTLAHALATGRVKMVSNSMVSHILCGNSTDVISGVACVDRLSKRYGEYYGKVVVLCASTIESIRIMLNTRSSRFPQGIGNTSGLLGTHLMDHLTVHASGTFPTIAGQTPGRLGGPHCMIIPRFQNLRTRTHKFIRGYGICGGIQRAPDHDRQSTTWFMHSLIEVLPQIENRVLLDEHRTDAWGIPIPTVNLNYCSNELMMKEHATESMAQMAAIGGLSTDSVGNTKPGEYVHEIGGARMGRYRSESVLTPHNRCWDAPGLLVVDGACFPTSGWQNPSHTMMAVAVRATSYLLKDLGSRK